MAPTIKFTISYSNVYTCASDICGERHDIIARPSSFKNFPNDKQTMSSSLQILMDQDDPFLSSNSF